VLYGGEIAAASFDVDARALRQALNASGAVLDLSIDGGQSTPVVVKEVQRHPVRGETLHVDLMRVRLDQAIHAIVALELTGAEDAPGARQGGVIEHLTREVNVQALPTAIPQAIVHDVSGMQIGETITLAEVRAPAGVTILDDPQIVVATISPPRLLPTEPETRIEAEAGLVGQTDAQGPEGSASSDSGSQE
jgi:large subunit ribosomal protein L25